MATPCVQPVCACKQGCCAVGQVFLWRPDVGVIAGEFNARRPRFKREYVVKRQGLEDGLDVGKAVGAAIQHVEVQVDLAMGMVTQHGRHGALPGDTPTWGAWVGVTTA
jgi:hypothetical protein